MWSFVKFLDERKSTAASSKYGSQFSEAFGKFYGQAKHGTSIDAVESSRAPGGSHENYITCIVALPHPGEITVKRFSTSGMDGKVVIWELNNLNDYFSHLTF